MPVGYLGSWMGLMTNRLRTFLLLWMMVSVLPAMAGENLLANPSFDDQITGWDHIWTREPSTGETSVEKGALKVSYTGKADWSVGQSHWTSVQPSEVYSFSGRVKVLDGAGTAQLSVVTRDEAGQVMDWMYALQQTSGAGDWKTIKGRFVVPASCRTAQFRITGWGAGSFLFDDLAYIREKEVPQGAGLKERLTAASTGLTMTLDPETKRLRLDASGASAYEFDVKDLVSSVVSSRKVGSDVFELRLVNPSGADLFATFAIASGHVRIALKGEGALLGDYGFPGPLLSHAGQSWVLPVNEGLLIPVDDTAFSTWDLQLYCGHGLAMPFIGLTDGKQGLLAIAETQDDAAVHYTAPQAGRTSAFTFDWQPSKQSWRYERVLRLVPVRGGHVAIAKAYRAYAREKGLLVTLREKAKTVPQVDKLVGAVNLWWWADGPTWRQDDSGAVSFGRTLIENGIRRVLWSHEQKPDAVEGLNILGFLTGRYDIYQDVWGPDDPSSWVNRDGWPDDLVLLPDGDWMKGWVDRAANGKEYPGGVICSERALVWEKKKVPSDLATHAYEARFLDTTTANPLRECYHPKHPMSRSDDRRNKMGLLSYLSQEKRLVTGSETGMDMAVPFVHYFEGMMSLGPYRLPDAGYDLTTYKVPHEEFKVFQLGPKYRIPLFELVYHDCVASSWYWGDSSNRVPEMWDERDVFNALYGTMPLWIVDPKIWEEHKARFVKSYRNGTTVARVTGYAEMTNHVFLTADHTVQETSFADGTKVWANLGKESYVVRKGVKVAPRSFRAELAGGKVLVP
jgi:hypothetical protein